MTFTRFLSLPLIVLFAGLLVSAGNTQEAKPIQVGMVQTFFHDIPPVIIKIVTDPFGEVMKTTTGVDGRLTVGKDAFTVAQELNDNKLQLGVFHGHEFAWVSKKYPDLKPLMIAVNRHRDVRAFIIVKKDSPLKTIADLRGKDLAMPIATKDHCRIYLNRHCTDNAQNDPKAFFKKIQKSETPEEALDEVCRGKVDAAIVDTIGLEFYKDIKEPCYNRLRVLQQSDAFPPVVIVYKEGAIPNAVVNKLRAGLLGAHNTEVGKDMMGMWKVAAFEQLPENYSKHLAEALKAYPSPEPTKISMR